MSRSCSTAPASGDGSAKPRRGTAAGDVIVKYTYAGDANLDGFISAGDYSAIDFNVAAPGTSAWSNGDFNFDGLISADDYSAIDFNLIAQGPPLSSRRCHL